MIITKHQLDESLREVLASMEEGKEYILTQEAWDEYQKARVSFGWKLSDEYRKDWSFKVKDNQLLFDCRYNHIVIKDISKAMATALAMATVTPPETAMALATNRIELKEEPSKSCDGKIVEIDGKKYELKEIR